MRPLMEISVDKKHWENAVKTKDFSWLRDYINCVTWNEKILVKIISNYAQPQKVDN